MTRLPTDPSEANAHLVAIRGLSPMWEYPLFDGRNIIGRAEERPVEIDLQPQEPDDRIFSSLQHASIDWDGHTLTIEDLRSENGTHLNSRQLRAGEKRPLKADDIIQIGEVEFKLIGGAPYEMARSSSRPGSGPRLLAVRGLQPAREYLITDGRNVVGRGDQKAVEIDLRDQEPDYRAWVSRQHACITRERDNLFVEDLHSANATYVNRRRVPPGVQRRLQAGDVIQVGEIQLKLIID